jgi:hypothetical protein
MIRIINLKRYNTDTARCLADWTNGKFTNDFNYLEEMLYRTPKGNYFILRDTYDTSDIIPLDADVAFDWLEKHNYPHVLEELIPERIEEA